MTTNLIYLLFSNKAFQIKKPRKGKCLALKYRQNQIRTANKRLSTVFTGKAKYCYNAAAAAAAVPDANKTNAFAHLSSSSSFSSNCTKKVQEKSTF